MKNRKLFTIVRTFLTFLILILIFNGVPKLISSNIWEEFALGLFAILILVSVLIVFIFDCINYFKSEDL